MYFSSKPSGRRFQKWITLLGILFMHIVALLMFKLGSHQRQVEVVKYLSLFNLAPIKKQADTDEKSVPPLPNLRKMVNVPKIHNPDTVTDVPKIELENDTKKMPNTPISAELNLDVLRGQAVQIERTRAKSDIEKMNNNKKLNLSIEATFDREVNKIELPECRHVLLGKSMPERMRIIQDHSKKMFCRSSM